MTVSTGRAGRRVLIIVENLPVPFDRRVWNEATTLREAGYTVSVICPKGPGAEKSFELLDGIAIYRHTLPLDARGGLGYLVEYSCALFWEFTLAWRVLFTRGFDVIHACNPPDLIFLVGGFFKVLFGKRFIFDHHDINPELYEAKFRRRDLFYRALLMAERLTFATADISIATNNSYREIAIARGKMAPQRVFVVRSGPSLKRLKILPPDPALRNGRRFLVGYVGVMGAQEGIQYLLEAARHIVHDLGRTDIQFGLVGGGPELETLKKLSRDLNLSDFVTFTGRAPDDLLLAMLNTADVCVNPDEFNAMNDKSTMNKIVEYMALGKPIVQFALTEGRYSAGEASLYAAPNDARDLAAKIVELIDDPEQRQRMGDIGRRRVVEELSWGHEAPKLLAAYDAAFAGRAGVLAPRALPVGDAPTKTP
jgi:glycosyltransferase involved in cell wall biosynthesis